MIFCLVNNRGKLNHEDEQQHSYYWSSWLHVLYWAIHTDNLGKQKYMHIGYPINLYRWGYFQLSRVTLHFVLKGDVESPTFLPCSCSFFVPFLFYRTYVYIDQELRKDWLSMLMIVTSARSSINIRHLEKATVSTGKEGLLSEGNAAYNWSRWTYVLFARQIMNILVETSS